jgi:hypothetical protein
MQRSIVVIIAILAINLSIVLCFAFFDPRQVLVVGGNFTLNGRAENIAMFDLLTQTYYQSLVLIK